MSAENPRPEPMYPPEQQAIPRMLGGRVLFDQIVEHADYLEITHDAGYYVTRTHNQEVVQMIAADRGCDDGLFFAFNTTYSHITGGRIWHMREMDAFVLDADHQRVAHLDPATIAVTKQDRTMTGDRKAGPLITERDDMVGIAHWVEPHIGLQPDPYANPPTRLDHREPEVLASGLLRRLRHFTSEDKQEQHVFLMGL